MSRRRIDWIQFALLLLALMGVAVRVESRLSHVEQHLTDQDRQTEAIGRRLDSIEDGLRK